jgi:hypothetical protein
MSQRTHRSASWARFDGLNTADRRREWAHQIATQGYAYCEHTSVLNASHEGRVEFRLPRGTLRLDRFYAKLEWAASMVEYTRDPANVVRPSDYMRWCKAQGPEYAMLVAYMTERFSAARFGEVGDGPAESSRARITDDELTAEHDRGVDIECDARGWSERDWYCERATGHTGIHAAPSQRGMADDWREVA